jgi:hypothetical protein
MIKTLAAVLVRELKSPKAQVAVVEDTIMHLSHEVFVAQYAHNRGRAPSMVTSQTDASEPLVDNVDAASPEPSEKFPKRRGSDGVVDVEESGKSSCFDSPRKWRHSKVCPEVWRYQTRIAV